MNKEFLFRVIKFGIVGFVGLLIDFSITYVLKESLELNKYIANTCGFVVAASNNYFLNRRWTFKSSNHKVMKEYSFFLIISIIGLLLNNFIIVALSDVLFDLNFYISKVIAVLIVFLWNYFMNSYFTFRYSVENKYEKDESLAG